MVTIKRYNAQARNSLWWSYYCGLGCGEAKAKAKEIKQTKHEKNWIVVVDTIHFSDQGPGKRKLLAIHDEGKRIPYIKRIKFVLVY